MELFEKIALIKNLNLGLIRCFHRMVLPLSFSPSKTPKISEKIIGAIRVGANVEFPSAESSSVGKMLIWPVETCLRIAFDV